MAATIALLALVTLVVADFIPFLSMTRLGEVREFSLISGVIELFKECNWLIGSVLLAFSGIFPFGKLIAFLISTSPLVSISPPARQKLHHLATVNGKYVLLD